MGVQHIITHVLLLLLTSKPFSFSSQCDGIYWQRIVVTDTACDRGGCQHEPQNNTNYHLNCCNLTDAVNLAQDGTMITIEKNDTLSDIPVNVSDISNLCIECNIDSCTIQCDTGNGTFLTFSHTNKLTLSNIIIDGCGILHKNYAAVLIRNSNDVTIQNVKIINSKNLGLNLFNIAGNVLINASVFSMNRPQLPTKLSRNLRSSLLSYTLKHNSVEQDSKRYYGGGMLIYINNTYTFANYTLENCNFTHNLKRHATHNKKRFAGDHGGGLYVYFDYNVSSITLTIVQCHFIGNSAGVGGGATIRLSHYVNNTTTSIQNCEFHNNIARNFSISNGGGLQIAFSPSHGHNNNIIIEGCNFTDNDAFFGGGMSIYSSSQAIKANHHLNNITITNCIWSKNKATSGAAVDVSQHFTDDLTNKKNLIIPNFKDCSFLENTIKLNNTGQDNNGNVRRENKMLQESVGNGIMSVNLMNVAFIGEVDFSNNIGSALTATKSIIYIESQSNVIFLNNTGINGGAILFEGFASLLISSNVAISFVENHALNYGGAIYSVITNDHMLLTKAACPINFQNASHHHGTDSSVNIDFINNTAKTNGASIYLSSLLPCQIAYSKHFDNLIEPNNTFNQSCFNFAKNYTTRHQIATAPSKYTYNNKSMRSHAINISVNPGEPYHLQLQLQDDLGQTVNETLFQAFVDTFEHSSLFISESNQYISDNYIIVKGPENNKAKILLQTVKKPLLNILFNVTTNQCPAGYKYNSATKICDCKASNYFGIKSCAPIQQGSNETYICKSTWAGYMKGKNGKKEFVTAPCHWFCSFNHSYSVTVKLPQHQFGNNSFLYNFICSSNRTGILCGKCKDGHTAYYHDLNFYCGPVHKGCQLGWLFFLLTEILPMTVIFMLITIIGFNITSGRVQGFLLFSHILVSLSITSHGTIDVSTSIHTMVQYLLRLFYYPLELKFFYTHHTSYCLSKKANSLEMVTLRYVNTFYALALIFVVVAFLKCFTGHCRGCSKWLRFTTAKASALHGLAALLVLSFTTCVETSLLLLQPSPIYAENFTTLGHRVAIYGDMIYFSKEHLKYAIPAITSLVLISVPVLMLLFYPLVTQLLSYFHLDADHTLIGFLLSKCFMYTRFKPFYDMFYAPFKDEHRYFAGLYLLYRALIQLPNFFSADIERYVMTELLLITFMLVHGIIQPYQKRAHNFIDGLLLGNLVIINGLSCINIITENIKASHYWKINTAAIFQMLLIYIPMTIVVFYVIYYILVQCLKCLNRHSRKHDYQQLFQSNSCSHLEHNRQAQLSLQNSISC